MATERIDILIQEINSKFELLLSGQVALQKKIDDLQIRLAARFDQQSLLIDAIGKKLDAIAEKNKP